MSGGIDLISFIQPKNNGAFPVQKDIYGFGGFQVRDDLSATPDVGRDAIPALNRKEGMLVYVISTSTTYRLGAGLTNADWTIVATNVIVAANLAALALVDVTGVADGTVAFVETLQAVWMLTSLSTAINDATQIVSFDPNRTWFRQESITTTFLGVGGWTINADTGNDENGGLGPGDALLSMEEVSRRYAGQTIRLPLLQFNIEPAVASVVMTFTAAFDPATSNVILIQGVFTSSAPTAITSLTAQNPLTNQRWIMTPTHARGTRITMTSGVATGALAYDTNGAGIMTSFVQCDPASLTVSTAAPVNGDNFKVDTLPPVTVGDFNMGTAFGEIVIQDLTVQGINSDIAIANGAVVYGNCIFQTSEVSTSVGNNQMLNNYSEALFQAGGGLTQVDAGINGGVQVNEGAICGFDYHTQSSAGYFCKGNGAIFYNAASFGSLGSATIVLDNGANASFQSSAAGQALWGTTAANSFLTVGQNSAFISTDTTKIYGTGALNGLNLAGNTTARPYNPATGGFAPLVTLSFANLALTLDAGGFNGTAHNPNAQSTFMSSNTPAESSGYRITAVTTTLVKGVDSTLEVAGVAPGATVVISMPGTAGGGVPKTGDQFTILSTDATIAAATVTISGNGSNIQDVNSNVISATPSVFNVAFSRAVYVYSSAGRWLLEN